MSYILIIGAKSDIAREVARKYASAGYDLYLAARSSVDLDPLANDIKIRTERDVRTCELDLLDFDSHEKVWDSLEPKPEGVICVAGYMSDQKEAEKNFAETRLMIETNYTGCVSILNIAANTFEAERKGFIVGVSSVAGDRGRKANYIYGSAKAAFTAYLSGLRNRLTESGVYVLTVKPGFVYTKMTKGLDLPEKLTAHPEDVAEDMFRAQQKKKNVLYTKWVWRLVMMVIRHIPEFMFKKMSI